MSVPAREDRRVTWHSNFCARLSRPLKTARHRGILQTSLSLRVRKVAADAPFQRLVSEAYFWRLVFDGWRTNSSASWAPFLPRFQLIDDSVISRGQSFSRKDPSGNACNSLAPSGNWAWRTLRRKLAGKTRGLTGQKLSPRSVRVGGDDRVRTHCVSLLVPSEEAADCNHQHDAGEANRKLHRNVVA